jgi:hypothetical protein
MAPEVNIDGAHICCGELAGYLDFNLNGHIHTTLYDFRIISTLKVVRRHSACGWKMRC